MAHARRTGSVLHTFSDSMAWMMQKRKGSIFVEMLMVLPLLLFVVVGGFALSELLAAYYHVAHATSLGMHQMMIDGGYTERAETIILSYLSNTHIDPNKTQITATPAVQPYGSPLSLRLQYSYPLNIMGYIQAPVMINIEHRGTSVHVPPPSP